jgi:hypothetical protein
MAGIKVTLLSFLERAAALAEQLPNPLLLLPTWLRNTIVTTAKFIFALASVVALVLYRNQVRVRRRARRALSATRYGHRRCRGVLTRLAPPPGAECDALPPGSARRVAGLCREPARAPPPRRAR